VLGGIAGVAAIFVWLQWRASGAPCETRMFDGSVFTVCEFLPERHELALVWADSKGRALGSFVALGERGGVDERRVQFAMNAGMFDKTGAPIGLFVANGIETHPANTKTGEGNFYLLPNGVFFMDEARKVRVEATERYLSRVRFKPVWATQSGPMLVIDGQLHAAFQPDGDSRHVRNGVGIASPDRAIFVISEEPVSFGKLARFFRDGLKCDNALYLDGSVSSLWEPATFRRDDDHALGPMVVVSSKAVRKTYAGF
jgi:uncharacterized protein YigE (DUF2233 family)